MSELHVVVGCNGPVGTELARQLRRAGHAVRGSCRGGRATLAEGAEIVAGDISNLDDARRICDGALVVYSCVGVDYTRWPELWPPIIDGLLAGSEAAGARLVFADNLYSYGPVRVPMTEDLAPTTFGIKPALRAQLSKRLLEAHESGRVGVVLGRASDFYGPGVTNAILGERVFPAALRGRSAQLLGDIDQPHSFSYVPDFARALVTLGAEERALGQIWNVPNAPALSVRQVVEQIYALAKTEPRLSPMPGWMLTLLALFVPIMRELKEMSFLWDRPYVVDHSKFENAFWGDFTPLDEGLKRTLEWYRES